MTTAAAKAALQASMAALSAQINALTPDAAPPPPPPPPPAGTAVALFLDAVTGPVGSILSVYGTGFDPAAKVFIGSTECVVVDRRAGVATKQAVQMIRATVPVLPAGPQQVSVRAGSSVAYAPETFTQCAGRVLYVALNGNDATAIPGDITKPWRNLQTPARGGAYATLRAGDHVVIRGGNWMDKGFDTAWLRFRDVAQQANANAWIHVTSYPGEDVHYSTPASSKGGFHGPSSSYAGTTGEYVSVSNLRMDVHANATSDAAPINLQSSFGNWRVVNNALGPWPSAINSKAAGVSGHGDNVKVFGNHIFGMACTGASENHGVYADSGASSWDIGWNYIHDITGGNLLQFFDNLGAAGNNYNGLPPNWNGFVGMQVHHNWMENSGKYGLNLADSTVAGRIWGNVIVGAKFAGLRINVISQGMAFVIEDNVFHDNDRAASGSGNGQVLNSWGNYGPTGTITVKNNKIAFGPASVAASQFYVQAGDTDAYLLLQGNTYYANNTGKAKPSKDATGVLNAGAMPSALLTIGGS